MYPKFKKPSMPHVPMGGKKPGYGSLVKKFETTVVMPENRKGRQHKRF